MKKRLLVLLLAGEAAALIALSSLHSLFPGAFSSLLAFPLEQIGAGLGLLAGVGPLGRGLAAALWAGLSLAPVCVALGARTWGRGERAALCLLSAALFPALYGMMSPASLLPAGVPAKEEFLRVLRAVLGGAVWSAAVLAVLARLLRLFSAGDRAQLLTWLRRLLAALCMLFTAALVLTCGGDLAESLGEAEGLLPKSLAVLRFAVSALPWVLDIAVTFAALDLLDAALAPEPEPAEDGGEDPPPEDDRLPAAASRLSRLCRAALALTAAATAGLDLLQVLLLRRLTDISVTVDIPLVSLAFTLLLLLFARLLTENRRLRRDNDLFI